MSEKLTPSVQANTNPSSTLDTDGTLAADGTLYADGTTNAKHYDAFCASTSDAIREANQSKTPLYIEAGASKRHIIGRDCSAQRLDISANSGIIDYQPAELVMVVCAATPVQTIAKVLADNQQMLACDPPTFAGKATIGGSLASNINGSSRPWAGSLRDAVLGAQLINGQGELLNFGGQVMKNVAGYDVSRVQSGALGTLGVITQLSLRVAPLPQHTLTLTYEMDAPEALALMHERCRQSQPITAAAWCAGQLHLRLAGAGVAVEHCATLWGGDQAATQPASTQQGGEESAFWQTLRERNWAGNDPDAPLWRLSLPATAPLHPAFDTTVIDWGGAQRWIQGDIDSSILHTWATQQRGHALLFSGGDRAGEVRGPTPQPMKRVQARLKNAFDPNNILNPGRLYSWL